MKALQTFPLRSTEGPDGVTPQHLKDILPEAPDNKLMDSMTQIINRKLAGSFPISINEIIFGGRLIALEKKGGGVRPLAIGYVFKRLVAICANHYVIARRSECLKSIQLGVGVPEGAEAGVHAKRRLLLQPSTDHVVVKLEFANAFDSAWRDLSLETIAINTPELYRFVHCDILR